MCAHTVAVAESLNCLRQFIEALQKSKPECSVTKLITTSCERCKPGTKSGAPRKRGTGLCKVPVTAYRSRLEDVCSSGHDTSAEARATTSAVGGSNGYGQRSSIAANKSSISGDISVGCTSQTFYSSCPPQYRNDYPYFSSYAYGEAQGMYGYDYSPYGSQFQSPSQVLSSSRNESSFTNPFIVKLLNK